MEETNNNQQDMSKEVQTDLFGNPVQNDSESVYVQKSLPKDLSNTIKTEYVLEIYCSDEKEQESMFNELQSRGFKCKVLTL